MRRLFAPIVVILFLLAPNIDASELTTGEFHATVNGQQFHSKQIQESTTFQPGIMAEHLVVAGGTLAVDILNFNGVGEYALSDGSTAQASFDQNGIRFTTDQTFTGSITVTSYDAIHHMIAGSVSFTARSATGQIVTVKNGSFRVG